MIIIEDDIKYQIESILFACGRKISIDELSQLLGIRVKEVIKDKLLELQKEYLDKNSSLMIVDEGDEWKVTVKEKYLSLVRKINPHTELSKTIMETLAVVAWKQPTRQSDVIRIRTNKAYDHIAELERMGFLVKEKYGRSFLLKLTQKFYDYFDLKDAQAAREMFKGVSVPALEEIEQTKVDEFEDAAEDVKENTSDVDGKEEKTTEDTEEDVYQKEDREKEVADDEVKPNEAAFVEGYEKDEEKSMEGKKEETAKKE
ncbi:SMC-Scp complex subunit ScpB [Candidatus Woesearchaeota archaeon]|nr:SMC-Scp complex subunit ScpB [Candidatus Woesearchaeota archaeon]